MTPEIYISYAWRDREQAPQPDDRESIVDALCDTLVQKNCTVRRDKTQVGYKKSIGDFMRDIGAAHQAVVVVSDKYLRSKYCMYEAVEILHRRDLERRLFPVVLDDAAIKNTLSAQTHLEMRFQHLLDVLLVAPTTPPNAEPVFTKLDVKKYNFDHALRPAQTKTLIARLPDSMNIIAQASQRHRV